MRTIERNYRKNPHTANFLMTFHTGGRGLPAEIIADDAEALATEAAQDEDLLNLVPADAVADLRSPAQAKLMDDLICQLGQLDHPTSIEALNYTDGMTIRGLWTPGREGNASKWISRMIAKIAQLKASAKTTPAPSVEVADGRYAVEEEGVLKFFKVENGRKAGFVFLDIQASDEWYSIRDRSRISRVLALIAADADAASLRYGRDIGECGDCGRTLTTKESRARGRGPICDAKH